MTTNKALSGPQRRLLREMAERERVYTGPSTGNTMIVLERRGLVRPDPPAPSIRDGFGEIRAWSYTHGWALTDAGREAAKEPR